MTEEPIINVEKLFQAVNLMTNEIKRTILGRYQKEKHYSTDLTNCLYIHNRCNECNNKISFTKSLTRCKYCESFALLTHEGELENGKDILIETGTYKNTRIIVNKFPRCNAERLGLYEYRPITKHTLLSTTNLPLDTTRIVCNSCNVFHHIIISILVNSLQTCFKSSLFGTWVCDTINTVSYYPMYGNIYNIKFNKKMFYDIFLQILLLCGSENFFIGDVDTDTFTFGNFSSQFTLQNKSIYNMILSLFVKPNEYSSFKLSKYEGKDIIINGPNTDVSIEEPQWNFFEDFISHSDIYPRSFYRITSNPSMSEYVKKRILLFKVTPEIIDYIRKSGVNALPALNFMRVITTFLTNRTFYQCFISSIFLNNFRSLFVGSDFDRYMQFIHANFDKKLSADDINNILIISNISIRFDAYYIFSTSCFPLYNNVK